MENIKNTRIKTCKNRKKKKLFGVRTKLLPNNFFFSENLLATQMNKTQITMNKSVYLVLLILDLSKRVMYEIWYDYLKSKYGKKTKLCYMDTGSFITHIKTKDIYKNISEDVKKRFNTSIMK